MKRLLVSVMLLALCASLSYAQQLPEISKKSFVVNVKQLGKYLELDDQQMCQVEDINDYFIEKQKESEWSSERFQEQRKIEAVYGNLKLMKEVLTVDQYRKYVVLLNVTNNSYRQEDANELTGTYYADAE